MIKIKSDFDYSQYEKSFTKKNSHRNSTSRSRYRINILVALVAGLSSEVYNINFDIFDKMICNSVYTYNIKYNKATDICINRWHSSSLLFCSEQVYILIFMCIDIPRR